MRIHFIRHAHFQCPGAFYYWAKANNHQISTTYTFAGEKLPDVSEFDFLIIMGGPQCPQKLNKFPYLIDEIRLIEIAIANNKLVMGICLGAQLVAESLGANTLNSPEKEVGLYPIELTEAGKQDYLLQQFPISFNAMHWHYNMPDLPKDAELLARSAGCPHQAFRYNQRVYGFQFHLEVNNVIISNMIQKFNHDLQPSQYTQTKEQLLNHDYDELNQKLVNILEHFTC